MGVSPDLLRTNVQMPVREPFEVPGWKRGWGGGRVRFGATLVFDVILVLGGLLFLLSDVGIAVTMLLFGIGTAFTLPLYVTWKRRGAIWIAPIPDAPGRVGLYFPYSRGKHRANAVGLLLMALACVVFMVVVPDLELRLAGMLSGIVLGMNAIRTFARPRTAPYIGLTEEGVVARVGPSSWFVPWAAIGNVAPVEIRMRSAREQFVGVAVVDRSLVEISRTGRRLMRLNRWLAVDLSYTTRGLEVDPALLFWAMHFYWRHPEMRVELSAQTALDRVASLDLFDGSSETAAGTPST